MGKILSAALNITLSLMFYLFLSSLCLKTCLKTVYVCIGCSNQRPLAFVMLKEDKYLILQLNKKFLVASDLSGCLTAPPQIVSLHGNVAKCIPAQKLQGIIDFSHMLDIGETEMPACNKKYYTPIFPSLFLCIRVQLYKKYQL